MKFIIVVTTLLCFIFQSYSSVNSSKFEFKKKDGTASEVVVYYIETGVYPTLGGTVEGAGEYNEGDSVYLRALPNAGYKFEKWMLDGVEVSTDSVLGIKISRDCSYFAYYTEMLQISSIINITGDYMKIITGDYDSDGDLDVFLYYGIQGSTRVNIIQNLGDNAYSENLNSAIRGTFPNARWIDIDNDNDLDFLIKCTDGIELYLNTDGDYTKAATITIPGFDIGNFEPGDFNNDGKIDLFVNKYNNLENKYTLLINTGAYTFSESKNVDLPIYTGFEPKLLDYNNDGFVDVLTMDCATSECLPIIYKNTGNGFDPNPVQVSSNACTSLKVADFNSDGLPDILASNQSDRISILINDGKNSFLEKYSWQQSGSYCPPSCGDLNNDGKPDVIYVKEAGRLYIQLSQSDDSFLTYKTECWFNVNDLIICDWNNDGKNDMLVFGRDYYNNPKIRIYENTFFISNKKPSKPEQLISKFEDDKLILNWNKSTDNETSSDGLNYRLWIKRKDRNNYSISPRSFVSKDSLDGKLLNLDEVNISWNSNGYVVNDLEIGDYEWSVQAIDAQFVGSGYAETQYFSINSRKPIVIIDSSVQSSINSVELFATVSAQNEPTSVEFQYTLTPDIDNSWKFVQVSNTIDGIEKIKLSTELNDLNYNSNYSYRVKANNKNGEVYSEIKKIKTQMLFSEEKNNFLVYSWGKPQWGDYDGDGDKDILVFGWDGTKNITKIYCNNNQEYVELSSLSLMGVNSGDAEWADYDNDGDLDFIITGDTSAFQNKTCVALYKNTGNNNFEKLSNVPFVGVGNTGCVDFIDFNNDGLKDVFIVGQSNQGPISVLYENKGADRFVTVANIGIRPFIYCSTSWADYNHDGLVDLLIGGGDWSKPYTYVYKNMGDGIFEEQAQIELTSVRHASVSWQDFNNDGELDIFVSGNSFENQGLLGIFENKKNDVFVECSATGIIPVYSAAAHYTDLNNDGLIDLLLSNYSYNKIHFYQNIGEFKFFDVTNQYLDNYVANFPSFNDFDNDGDLDILMNSYIGDAPYFELKLYRNDIVKKNYSPKSPKILEAEVKNGSVVLRWNKVLDNDNPSVPLTYNVKVGSKSGGVDIVSPSSLSNGKLTVPELGMIKTDTFCIIKNLPAGTYCFSVQSVDNGFASSEFSEEISFFVFPLAPEAEDKGFCYKQQEPELEAIGEEIKWYSDAELNVLLHQGNTYKPLLPSPGKYVFYITQTVEGATSMADSVYCTIFDNPIVTIVDSVGATCNGLNDGFAVVLASGTTGSYRYSWDNNESSIDTVIYNLIPQKLYTVYAYDLNGCMGQVSFTISEPESLVLNSDFSEKICYGANTGYIDIDVQGGTPGYYFNWSDGANEINRKNLYAGEYQLVIKDKNQCEITEVFNITDVKPYDAQNICLVSVENGHNHVIWEKPHEKGVLSYLIYRETDEEGIYEEIGSVLENEKSIFIDEESNPNIRAYQYKISVIDTCGNESELSTFHRTMHLQISIGIGAINLNWDQYIAEGEKSVFKKYEILRGSSIENMDTIASIGSNYHSFTDENFPVGTNYYQVRGVKFDACVVEENSRSEYRYISTNIKKNQETSIELSDKTDVRIFPNLVSSRLFVDSPSEIITAVSIVNALGIVVCNKSTFSNFETLDADNLHEGSYVVKVLLNNGESITTLIQKR